MSAPPQAETSPARRKIDRSKTGPHRPHRANQLLIETAQVVDLQRDANGVWRAP